MTSIIPTNCVQNSLISGYLFSDFHLVAAGEDLEVGFEGALLQNPIVLLRVEGLPEQDIVLQGGVLNPRLLRHIRQPSLKGTRNFLIVSDLKVMKTVNYVAWPFLVFFDQCLGPRRRKLLLKQQEHFRRKLVVHFRQLFSYDIPGDGVFVIQMVLSSETKSKESDTVIEKSLTLTFTIPCSFSISPSMAEISELFPQPTGPTTANSSPSEMSRSTLKQSQNTLAGGQSSCHAALNSRGFWNLWTQ